MRQYLGFSPPSGPCGRGGAEFSVVSSPLGRRRPGGPTAMNQVTRKFPLRKHDFLDEFLGSWNAVQATHTLAHCNSHASDEVKTGASRQAVVAARHVVEEIGIDLAGSDAVGHSVTAPGVQVAIKLMQELAAASLHVHCQDASHQRSCQAGTPDAITTYGPGAGTV